MYVELPVLKKVPGSWGWDSNTGLHGADPSTILSILVKSMGDRKKRERKGGGRKDRRNYKRGKRQASPGRIFFIRDLRQRAKK